MVFTSDGNGEDEPDYCRSALTHAAESFCILSRDFNIVCKIDRGESRRARHDSRGSGVGLAIGASVVHTDIRSFSPTSLEGVPWEQVLRLLRARTMRRQNGCHRE